MRAAPERRRVAVTILLTLIALAVTVDATAQDDAGYRVPDRSLVDIIDAPKTPSFSISPTREWGVLVSRPGYPSIGELSEPELKLAGVRIKPGSFSRSRVWPNNRLEFVRIEDLESRVVTNLPESPRLSNVRWSPDGEHLCFTNTTPDGVELWAVPVATAEARRLTDAVVSLSAGDAPFWLNDSATIVACFRPFDRTGDARPPAAPRVPAGPIVQESIGTEAPARTYQDLLEDAHDEELFDWYFTARVGLVDVSGNVTLIGDPKILWGVSSSPDGSYLLVQSLHRPYS